MKLTTVLKRCEKVAEIEKVENEFYNQRTGERGTNTTWYVYGKNYVATIYPNGCSENAFVSMIKKGQQDDCQRDVFYSFFPKTVKEIIDYLTR